MSSRSLHFSKCYYMTVIAFQSNINSVAPWHNEKVITARSQCSAAFRVLLRSPSFIEGYSQSVAPLFQTSLCQRLQVSLCNRHALWKECSHLLYHHGTEPWRGYKATKGICFILCAKLRYQNRNVCAQYTLFMLSIFGFLLQFSHE